MVTIFKGSYLEAMSIKNLLESHNIKVFIINGVSTSKPWVISAGGFRLANLKVMEVEYEIAKKVMDDYYDWKNDLKPIIPQ